MALDRKSKLYLAIGQELGCLDCIIATLPDSLVLKKTKMKQYVDTLFDYIQELIDVDEEIGATAEYFSSLKKEDNNE